MHALASAILLFAAFSHRPTLPSTVVRCLADRTGVSLDQQQQPPYLEVRFTKTGKRYYVVAVREQASGMSRAQVCGPDGKGILLGSRNGNAPFSDFKNYNYMSSEWRVCTKKEVLGMRRYYKEVPEPANEAVCLLWEDGEAIIYYDGKQFRWKSFAP